MTNHLRNLVLISVVTWFVCPVFATTEKYRLTWRDDPATTMVIAWHQRDGADPVVCYGTTDHGRVFDAYPQHIEPHHNLQYRGMNSHFARLTGLKPDMAYYFVIHDSNSISRRLWFRTAPDKPKPFTFIAGGDTRTNAEPRRDGNRLIARLRPLFVAHGGDYMGSGTSEQWQQWLDDWQLTISTDGRIYPLLPAHGNHENRDMFMVYKLFDMSREDMYHVVDIGGNLMRVYTLNTEIVNQPEKWKAQRDWLADDLAKHGQRTWKFVQYHKPMRPHTRAKAEGLAQIQAWAGLFYDHGVDLAIECDTHMVKRTYPIRPADELDSYEGFVRDDERGTIYIGEGSWGAPRRPANDDKPWTMASDSFYQFKWIHVKPEHLDILCVRFENVDDIESVSDDAPMTMPEGLVLWEPPTGIVLRLPFDPESETFNEPPPWFELVSRGSTWRYDDTGALPGDDWYTPEYNDSKWKSGRAPLGYGDDGEKTVLDFGSDPRHKHAAYYFRKSFNVDAVDFGRLVKLSIEVFADDGFIAYLNGKMIGRSNMPDGPITYQTFASKAVPDASGTSLDVPPALLRRGVNHLGIEVHQANPRSSDIALDARVRYQSP